jgi:hypothetical protein
MDTATHNTIERRVLELAKSQGLEPSRLSRAVYQRLYVQAYAELGKSRQAAGSIVNAAANLVLGRRLSKEVVEANHAICRSCPHGKYRVMNGSPTCDGCGCSGRMLAIKWRDPNQHCPLTVSGKRCDFAGEFSPNDKSDPPVWDNRSRKSGAHDAT